MNLTEAKALLPEMRHVLECVGSEWIESYDSKSGYSQIAERDGLDGQVYPLATLAKDIPTEQRELMRKAPVYLRAALLLRDEAARAYLAVTRPPAEKAEKKEAKALSTIAVGKCAADRAFIRYLIECHGLEDASNTERVKTKVRSVLAIQSFKELNDDPRAAEAWQKLISKFQAWMRSGQ